MVKSTRRDTKARLVKSWSARLLHPAAHAAGAHSRYRAVPQTYPQIGVPRILMAPVLPIDTPDPTAKKGSVPYQNWMTCIARLTPFKGTAANFT